METKQLGPWIFNSADFSISDNTQRIELEPLLCKLLAYFADNAGRIVSRQQLVDEIWQQSFVDDNAINRAISELRKVLQHPTLSQSPIKTHHRKGYSLQLVCAETKNIDATETEQAHSNLSAENEKPPGNRRFFILAVGIVLLAIASFTFFWSGNDLVPAEAIEQPNLEQRHKLSLTTQQKVTWFKGVESRPLMSPNKQLLAYGHAQADGSMRVLVRKASAMISGKAIQEIAIEQENTYYVPHSWQPKSQHLLVQSLSRDGQTCHYLNYDFSRYPNFTVSQVSDCKGFLLGNAQLSEDGQWLYQSTTNGGMYGSNALVGTNLTNNNTQVLVAAPETGLGVVMLALSPDGSKLAYEFMSESNHPEIFIYDVQTREHQRLAAMPVRALVMGIDWSSDQSTLYLPGTNAILTLNVKTKALSVLQLPEDVIAGELTLAGENQAYISALSSSAITENAMQLIKVSFPFDESRRVFTPINDAAGSAISPELSPVQPNRYAFSANWSGNWQLWLHDKGQNRQLTEFSDAHGPITSVCWSSDGRFIAFVKAGNLYLYDIEQHLVIPKLENNDIGQPQWLPDNSGMVLTRLQHDNQNLWQLDLASNALTQLTFGGANQAQFDKQGQLYYHRDGRLIRYVDGKRSDIDVLNADDNSTYVAVSKLRNNEQWRYGIFGHIQRRSLTGEVLQQTQLPYQLVGIHFNPANQDELYLSVFTTPELALEFIQWQPVP
ncbi:winged helix-turn-helix domain-containing protein [Rheinheimera baltica]|uniref:winged helix-turn-helix domain-containing protein n=1 Tax=Rheinheimera baltica TaxID=67576 RepID=UPI00273FC2F4|nr:winged helix-turn-helix domain-containing protein [Rheinheimera baltica]MDP5189815.1 winged helix-turn-helix domain-containing protein [Rheinheimera baltica]